ncbi:50S ribosomal protein L11, chloroplastic-like [Juglans microcarpa x Juglans regia]|uniref:50S ribosomal protein L11, chloroplastic-like n=1 Tax=Juglans microcarpa x Juglans regia TaxID=2249226 RepID=UPI001B7D9CFC|nr:50S ribosomal protein L11, chloroplastic-like [Juglans microcarpa x Juglans regia]XP_040990701.1 50S ribosomal protein L11, chloroplastic-like [Juglans microcarpa x Juglans regia]
MSSLSKAWAYSPLLLPSVQSVLPKPTPYLSYSKFDSSTSHCASHKPLVGLIKLALEAVKATPAPPVGPALGSKGVNIMAFCKDYNARTADKAGYVIPVYDGVEKGSKDPKMEKVGKITINQLHTIAAEKLPDLNCTSIELAIRIIAGTAANMGIDVDPPVLEQKKKGSASARWNIYLPFGLGFPHYCCC